MRDGVDAQTSNHLIFNCFFPDYPYITRSDIERKAWKNLGRLRRSFSAFYPNETGFSGNFANNAIRKKRIEAR